MKLSYLLNFQNDVELRHYKRVRSSRFCYFLCFLRMLYSNLKIGSSNCLEGNSEDSNKHNLIQIVSSPHCLISLERFFSSLNVLLVFYIGTTVMKVLDPL